MAPRIPSKLLQTKIQSAEEERRMQKAELRVQAEGEKTNKSDKVSNRAIAIDNYSGYMEDRAEAKLQEDAEKARSQAERAARSVLKTEAEAWKRGDIEKRRKQREADLAAWEEEKRELKEMGVRGMPKKPKAPVPTLIPDIYKEFLQQSKRAQEVEGEVQDMDGEEMEVDDDNRD